MHIWLMFRVILYVMLLLALGNCQSRLSYKTMYVTPQPQAGASGTIDDPLGLVEAISLATPGTAIVLRNGVYTLGETLVIPAHKSGTEDRVIRLGVFANESAVLDFSRQKTDTKNRGIELKADWWEIHAITVTRAGDNGIYISGNHNKILHVTTSFNRDSGLQLGRASSEDKFFKWPAYNLISHSVSHDNADANGENADGFAAKLSVGPGNIFRHCVAHNNADDGWDLYTKASLGKIGAVTIEHSIAYQNGTLSDGRQFANGDKNGFKLGGESLPVAHILSHNLAIANGKHGFTYNKNPAVMRIDSNIAINNLQSNFYFPLGTSTFTHNLSCNKYPAKKDRVSSTAQRKNQWWQASNSEKCLSHTQEKFFWRFGKNGQLIYGFN